MKDLCINFEKNDDHRDDKLQKFMNNELDFNCHGISFSDSSCVIFEMFYILLLIIFSLLQLILQIIQN
jgi:hypothetical protein